jgi:hypothetical protein
MTTASLFPGVLRIIPGHDPQLSTPQLYLLSLCLLVLLGPLIMRSAWKAWNVLLWLIGKTIIVVVEKTIEIILLALGLLGLLEAIVGGIFR